MNILSIFKQFSSFYILCIFLFVGNINTLFAQEIIQKLEKNFNESKFNSETRYENGVKLISEFYKLNQYEQGLKIVDQNIQEAIKAKNDKYITYFYAYKAFLITVTSDQNDAKIINNINLAKKHVAKINDPELLGYIQYVEGEYENKKNEKIAAIDHFIKSIQYYDKAPPSKKLIARKINTYRELSSVYGRIGDFDLQEKFAKIALELSLHQDNKQLLFDSYVAMGYLYINHLTKVQSEKYKVEVEKNYLAALKLLNDNPELNSNSPSNYGYINNNLANFYYIHYDKSYRNKVRYHAYETLNAAKKNNIPIQIAAAYGLLSDLELENKNYFQAKVYLNNALQEFNNSNNTSKDENIELMILESLSKISEEEGDYKNALIAYQNYLKKFQEIYNHDILKTTKELEAKFDKERNEQKIFTLALEADKKQQHILLMQAEARQQLRDLENLRLKDENQRKILELSELEAEKNMQALRNSELESTKRAQALKLSQLESLKKSEDLKSYINELKLKEKINKYYISIIIAILLFIALIGYSTWQRVKNMKQTEKMHLLEIEKQKQNAKISTLTALLKGQEDERSRVAKDLHDGLGGLLSGTKIQLTHLNNKINADSKQDLSKSINQLDNAVDELRRVAHNLMPDLLVNYGLEEALAEYANRMSHENLEIDVQFLSYSNAMDKETQLIVYRIIQELVNNAIKHANPTQIIIQLVEDEAKYYVTVEDDGKGFDIKNKKLTNSAGLHNIKSRIEFLKGNLEINSEINLGTSIEFNFQKN